MAGNNPYGGTTDFDMQLAALNRRRKMAELLQADALKDLRQPQHAGRTSILEPLGQMAKAFAAVHLGGNADEEDAKLSAARQKELNTQLGLLKGTPTEVPTDAAIASTAGPSLDTIAQQGAAAPTPEAAAPPTPTLRDIITQGIDAAGTKTELKPLTQEDRLPILQRVGNLVGGPAGATITSHAIDKYVDATTPTNKTAKVGWGTGHDAQGRTIYGWHDEGTGGFTQVGGAKPKEPTVREQDLALWTDYLKDKFPTLSEADRKTTATGLVVGDLKIMPGPDGVPQIVSQAAQMVGNAPKISAAGGGMIPQPVNAAAPAPPAPAMIPAPAPAAPPGMIPKPPTGPAEFQALTNKIRAEQPARDQASVELLRNELAAEQAKVPANEQELFTQQRNIAALTKEISGKMKGAAPAAAAPAAAAPAAAPVTPKQLPFPERMTDQGSLTEYRRDFRNKPFLPTESQPGVLSPPSDKWIERQQTELGKINAERFKYKLPDLEQGMFNFTQTTTQLAKNFPEAGIVIDPKTGVPSGKAPGMGWAKLNPLQQKQQAQFMQQAFADAENMLTLANSGQAVSAQEGERIRKQLGTDWKNSPETFWQGVAALKDKIRAKHAEIMRVYPPVIHDAWAATPEGARFTERPALRPGAEAPTDVLASTPPSRRDELGSSYKIPKR